MSCNDIILSFLEDIAQDANWEESFQFPESVLNEVKTGSAADNDQKPDNNLVSVPGCLTKLSPVTVPSKLNEFCEGSPDGNSPISSSSANSNDGSTSRGTILSTETGSKDSHMLENFVVTPPHISSTTHTSLIDSPGFSDNSTIEHISTTDSNNSGSDIEDYCFEQQLCHIDWGVGEKFDWGMGAGKMTRTDGSISTSKGLKIKHPQQKKNLLMKNKKRKYEKSSKKKGKLSAEEMLICVVNILRAKNSPPSEIEARKNITKNPLHVTQEFIQNLLGVTITTSDSLLNFIVPTGILESKSLSSLADRANARLTLHEQPKSWATFVNTETSPALRFPERHDSIMKINGAARQFASCLATLLSPDVVNDESICYTVTLNYDAAILSKPTRQLAAPFIWRSKGLSSCGFSSELEFNGLIRCSFNKFGIITLACLSFDACSLVRHCHNLSNHSTFSSRAQKQLDTEKRDLQIPGVSLSSIIEGLPALR